MKFLVACFCFALMLTGCAPATKVADNKQQADSHYKMAVAHLQANNPTLALKELLAAVQNDPENSAIHAALGQVYQRKKAYLQAERHYLRALELSDNDPRYQNNLATLYLDLQRWDEAIDYFDKASRNLLFIDAHVAAAGKAYALFKKEDYASALKGYDEALGLAPRYAEAHYLKSRVYLAMENSEMAEYELRQAIDIVPQFLQARYELGMMLLEQGKPEEAKNEFQLIVNFAENSEWGVKAKKILKTL